MKGICGDREVWRERMIDDVGISAVRIWIRLTTISEDRGYCFRKGVMVGVDGTAKKMVSEGRWGCLVSVRAQECRYDGK